MKLQVNDLTVTAGALLPFNTIMNHLNKHTTINAGLALNGERRFKSCSIHRYRTNSGHACFLDTRGLPLGTHRLMIWPSTAMTDSIKFPFTITEEEDYNVGLADSITAFYGYLHKWVSNLEEYDSTIVLSFLKLSPDSFTGKLVVSPANSKNYVEFFPGDFDECFESLLRLISAHYGSFFNTISATDLKELDDYLGEVIKPESKQDINLARLTSIFPYI